MNLDKNIGNAFEVVRKTYENVEKLMSSLDRETLSRGYESSKERFLRYSSDVYVDGWLFNDIVKIYQFSQDRLIESNDWLDGPIYVVDICFYDNPKIKVGNFHYKNMEEWSRGISASSSCYFTNPLNKDFHSDDFCYKDIDGYIVVKPRREEVSKKYWGLEKCMFKEFKLSEIVDDSGVKKLIDVFDDLNKISNG